MYQELVKYPDGTRVHNVLLVVAIVLGVFAISTLSWFFKELGAPLMDFLAFGALIAFAAVIYFKRIVEYRYSLMHTELIVARKVGKREKNVLSLEVTEIVSIGVVNKACGIAAKRHTVRTKRLPAVQIVYRTGSGDKCVILQPSAHMLQLIQAHAACKRPKTSAE